MDSAPRIDRDVVQKVRADLGKTCGTHTFISFVDSILNSCEGSDVILQPRVILKAWSSPADLLLDGYLLDEPDVAILLMAQPPEEQIEYYRWAASQQQERAANPSPSDSVQDTVLAQLMCAYFESKARVFATAALINGAWSVPQVRLYQKHLLQLHPGDGVPELLHRLRGSANGLPIVVWYQHIHRILAGVDAVDGGAVTAGCGVDPSVASAPISAMIEGCAHPGTSTSPTGRPNDADVGTSGRIAPVEPLSRDRRLLGQPPAPAGGNRFVRCGPSAPRPVLPPAPAGRVSSGTHQVAAVTDAFRHASLGPVDADSADPPGPQCLGPSAPGGPTQKRPPPSPADSDTRRVQSGGELRPRLGSSQGGTKAARVELWGEARETVDAQDVFNSHRCLVQGRERPSGRTPVTPHAQNAPPSGVVPRAAISPWVIAESLWPMHEPHDELIAVGLKRLLEAYNAESSGGRTAGSHDRPRAIVMPQEISSTLVQSISPDARRTRVADYCSRTPQKTANDDPVTRWLERTEILTYHALFIPIKVSHQWNLVVCLRPDMYPVSTPKQASRPGRSGSSTLQGRGAMQLVYFVPTGTDRDEHAMFLRSRLYNMIHASLPNRGRLNSPVPTTRSGMDSLMPLKMACTLGDAADIDSGFTTLLQAEVCMHRLSRDSRAPAGVSDTTSEAVVTAGLLESCSELSVAHVHSYRIMLTDFFVHDMLLPAAAADESAVIDEKCQKTMTDAKWYLADIADPESFPSASDDPCAARDCFKVSLWSDFVEAYADVVAMLSQIHASWFQDGIQGSATR